MLDVKIVDDRYVLSFPNYDPDLVNFCRNLQSARYSAAARCWTAPRNLPNALDLHKGEFFSDLEMLKLRQGPETPSPVNAVFDWTINANLFDHQKHWQKEAAKPKILCRADPGLGKTLMAMLWWEQQNTHPHDLLVICPTSLLKNWQIEIEKFTGHKAIIVKGAPLRKQALAREKGLHLIGYDSFVRMLDEFKAKRAIVIDESHKMKNPSTERSKAIHKYCSMGTRDRVLLLTGTPITQGPQDYYSQFKVIEPRLLGASYTAFKRRYCEEEQVRGAPFGVKKITGYKNLDELIAIVSPYMASYDKTKCLDLPAKTFQTRYVELPDEQKSFYRQLKNEMALWLNEEAKEGLVTAPNILTRLLKFSQITQGFLRLDDGKEHEFKDNPKLNMVEEIVSDLPNESIVIMCRFTRDIQYLERMMRFLKRPYGVIDGSVSLDDRQKVVDDFQMGKISILIGQVACAGLGFTLTRASTMIFYSNTYSWADRVQAEDRIHRIGTQGTCLYIDIVAQETVDEHIVEALRSKKDVAQMVAGVTQHFKE